MDDLEWRVREFVYERVPELPIDADLDTDVVMAARIDGDDLWEFVEEFATCFGVRMDGFRWYHHGGPEGCNPLWLVLRPWWAREPYIPIRLSDLIESARRGAWSVQYPPNRDGR